MKRKRINFFLIAVVILFASLFLIYRYILIKPYLNIKNIQEISIIALPSPPKVKHITNQKDIEAFVNLLNSNEFTPNTNYNSKGWQYNIKIKGNEDHSIYIAGNNLEFDGVWYSAESNILDNMKELYKMYDYPELDYPEKTK